jgi:hypothetical protein
MEPRASQTDFPLKYYVSMRYAWLPTAEQTTPHSGQPWSPWRLRLVVRHKRCMVERLMKRLGLQGARRGKIVRTTRSATTKRRARWTRSIGSSMRTDFVLDAVEQALYDGQTEPNNSLNGYLGSTTIDCLNLSDIFPPSKSSSQLISPASIVAA